METLNTFITLKLEMIMKLLQEDIWNNVRARTCLFSSILHFEMYHSRITFFKKLGINLYPSATNGTGMLEEYLY